MPAPDSVFHAPNANHLWAALLVEELVRHGVTHFVVAPGSRSTPLAAAVAQNPRAEAHVHIDERGGAFLALGIGRATGIPAAWITTSGTAVANGLPAAVEADAAGVPLLLVTADRPPELRDTGANQTIRQPPLFASVARWATDLAPPTPEVDPAYVLTSAAHAVARARGLHPGPVHLNCPFREPLAPVENGTGALPDHLQAWASGVAPYTETIEVRTAPAPEAVASAAQALSGCRRVLLVAGQGADAAACRRAAEATGWVLLADVLSGARTPEASGAPFYDLALSSAAFAASHAPDAVVHVGARPTSKRLQALIDRAPLAIRISPEAGRLDPAHRVTHRITADPGPALDALAAAVRSSPEAGWREAWNAASGAVAGVIEDALSGGEITEPHVARTVAALAPSALVVAASMPIRDVDSFGQPLAPVFANRGASGIDGTVATAGGVARGLGAPTVLLIGDLALLHDLNSLALLRSGPPVVVVAVNNDGGGIFHFLPIAPGGSGPAPLAPEAFEPFFGTPHGLDFADAAAMFGLRYYAPDSARFFERYLEEALASGASAIIEVCTDRHANAALHRAITARCAEAVGATL
ncbi:2-succinyl-5-enolpyruvyl-6-hydroxy-3-cyclohexene-1-carboxylic-acid synthase [Rubricoccus marinus]|uniref:2-succinyl-5-enolpyruvyl-6-hydroxy-3-cyclohexene-1-carboxylate synthase n=1 Tax=Rubricoccus marinus TaxID=716817 RepID=A0A259U303_9BACT|nr:2-succinyl-5-enolpyruvyl-6-hydroxy-3-cyclohexene-1-carboxylic-acid synthase [Rubricoccus marinus]OZC04336.1 2-succinyl-5-enolpyruvyl-6-hydroxy-3-cyclohexene-1-carboxylic-acid synthase [Rubricoccus marinus]